MPPDTPLADAIMVMPMLLVQTVTLPSLQAISPLVTPLPMVLDPRNATTHWLSTLGHVISHRMTAITNTLKEAAIISASLDADGAMEPQIVAVPFRWMLLIGGL